MALYEHIYIARQDVSRSHVEELTKNITEMVEKQGGKVAKTEYWGLRILAYRINKNRKGHYSLLQLNCAPEAVAEVERNLRINEDVLRYMTVSVEEHLEEPSAILTRKDRDHKRRGRP